MLGELGDIQATLHVEVRRAQNLAAPEGAGEFKPYVRLRFNHVERETDYIPGPDPVWEDAAFEFACSNVNLSRSKLVAEVWNWHLDQDHELVGHVEVPIQSLVPHEHEVAYAMKDPKADSEAGKLGLVLYFTQAAPRLFEVPQNNMYSELAKPEPEPEPEAKRSPLLALILIILTLVGLILVFYPRTPDVTFAFSLEHPTVRQTPNGNAYFDLHGNATATVFNPGNVGYQVRSLGMSAYYAFETTSGGLDGYKITPDPLVDMGEVVDAYIAARENGLVRLPVNITALVSTTVFKLIQKDCKKEPSTLKLTFFGDGEAAWYYGFGSQTFQVDVETPLGCDGVQMDGDGSGGDGSGSGKNGTAAGE